MQRDRRNRTKGESIAQDTTEMCGKEIGKP